MISVLTLIPFRGKSLMLSSYCPGGKTPPWTDTSCCFSGFKSLSSSNWLNLSLFCFPVPFQNPLEDVCIRVDTSGTLTVFEEYRLKIPKRGRRLGIQAPTTAMHGSITDHSTASTTAPVVRQRLSGNGKRRSVGMDVREKGYEHVMSSPCLILQSTMTQTMLTRMTLEQD